MAERLHASQQENLISLLAHDQANGKLVARLAVPELFEGEYRVIAERCIDYWAMHKTAPGVHTSDLFGEILDDPKNRKSETYGRILRNMAMLSESMNTEYVLESLRTFTRTQRMKDAILKSAEKLNQHQELAIGEVEEMLADMLRVRELNFDTGITLNEVDKVVDFLGTHYSEFRTGIATLDRGGIVPARGAVTLLLAPTGRGKTWGLCHYGKHALLQRKKVVHISLEISEEEVAQRYYQMLFSIPKHRKDVDVSTFTQDEESFKIDEYARDTITPEVTFDDDTIRKKLKRLVKPWSKRISDLRIKRFPMRSLTMNGMRAYLDGLEAIDGFIPDMIILDYIGITNTDANNLRISLGRALEEFRAVCTERNAAGVTAHQVSKLGADAAVVKATHVAEDWSLIATSDQAITYSQTEAEEKLGLARLFVAKARSEEDKFGVIITQSYKLGQFCLQDAPLDKAYYEHLKDVEADADVHNGTDDDEPEPERRSVRPRARRQNGYAAPA